MTSLYLGSVSRKRTTFTREHLYRWQDSNSHF